jgi:hypothetical protein
MISSNTVAEASIRLTCSDGSSAATAIVLASNVAASVANIPDFNVTRNILLREFTRFESQRAELMRP